MNITFRQIRAFVEVATTLSFTMAARNLNLTQSAVSMLVRQLELEYGLTLFDRVKRKVTLTEAGREMLPVTQRILDDMRLVEEGADDLRSLRRGSLRVAAPQTIACTMLTELAAPFARDMPDVAVQIVDTSGDGVVAALMADQADIGIGPERPVPPQIVAAPLWQEPINIVVPAHSSFPDQKDLNWSELADQNWIQYSDEFTMFLQRTLLIGMQRVAPQTLQVRHLTTALAFVGQGMGITAAPHYARKFEPLFPVRFIQGSAPLLMRQFQLYSRKGHSLSPATKVFLDRLHDWLKDREQTG